MTGNWTVKLALLLATPPEHLNPPAINKVPQRAEIVELMMVI